MNNSSRTRQQLITRLYPYILLSVVLLTFFVLLALLGLNLGFVGDILGFEYHFANDGITGGLQYTLDHDRRHFLSGIFYAVLHFLFPNQPAAWYGTSIFLHFGNAFVGFLLTDTLLSGKRRWLSFAIALMFAFHLNQVVDHFEIATGGHLKLGLGLALFSLWCYLRYVRGGRKAVLWRDSAGIAYVIAFMLYESTFLFFLINPLIAYIEDHRAGRLTTWQRWLWQNIQDTFWYPMFFLIYVALLSVMIPPAKDRFFIAHIPNNIIGALRTEFWIGDYLNRLSPLLTATGLPLMAAAAAGFAVLIGIWRHVDVPQTSKREAQTPISNLGYILLVGAGIVLTNIIAVAASEWYLPDAPRLIYPAAFGASILICGGIAWLTDRLPRRSLRAAVFALITVIFIAPGTIRFTQAQAQYQQEFVARQRVIDAVVRAVPAWQGDTPPYLLLVSDLQPDELALHALDIRFPYNWDMAYGVEGILADAVYRRDNPRFPQDLPADDEPIERYVGTYIVIENNTIYSAVRPGIPIDPARLVIIYYDSITDTARVLDSLPEDVLANGNIIRRDPMPLTTNFSLIASQERAEND